MSPFSVRLLVLGLISLGAAGCQSAAKQNALTSAPPASSVTQVPAPPPIPTIEPGDFADGFRQPGASYVPPRVPKDARMVKVE